MKMLRCGVCKIWKLKTTLRDSEATKPLGWRALGSASGISSAD